MQKRPSRFHLWRERARVLLDVRGPQEEGRPPKWKRFIHFWVLVWVSFNRNRCPVRASALAYASLLALIPMLAVVMSITSSLLKKQGEDRINEFIGKVVASLTPPAPLSTNTVSHTTAATRTNENASSTDMPQTGQPQSSGTNETAAAESSDDGLDDMHGAAAFEDQQTLAARKAVAQHINQFIQNTRSGALGVTGSVVLIFAAISLLSRIEVTFNDIWGIERGRTWFMRIVLYWGVLSLAPVLLVVAFGLATGPHLHSTQRFLASLPFIGNFIFQFLPALLLCLTFGAFYMLMPNTKVNWGAALVGGLVAGLMFHANNLVSVLYVSRVVSNSKIYGSIGLVPVFMIGLYFSWLIVLLGAQVAYAFQNRAIYAEEKQVENINQRGREFIALRLMTLVGQRYLRGEPPYTTVEMAEEICVPTRLVRQVMQILEAARLVIETAGGDPAYTPARPMENITCHDILEAMRSTQGQELATREEPTRAEVYGEFQRILEAERRAASSVSMLTLAHRAQAQLQHNQPKALAEAH
jgi:membrane protein